MASNKLVASHAQGHSSHETDFSRRRTPGLLAETPVIGLILFLFGGLVFGGLVFNLLDQGPLIKWDNVLASTLPAIALKSPPFVHALMNAGFYIGDQVIAVASILLGIYFIIKRHWQELALMTFGLVGASALFLSLTALLDRMRPSTQIWIIVNLPGFPSGHSISAVTFYGLLAYLFAPKIASKFWKVVVAFAAVFIIVFIGFSRVFTGGHYLTDVLAGYAIGIAWSGAIFTVIEIIFQKRRSYNVKRN